MRFPSRLKHIRQGMGEDCKRSIWQSYSEREVDWEGRFISVIDWLMI